MGAVPHDPSDTGVGGSFRDFSGEQKGEREDAAEYIIMGLETDRDPDKRVSNLFNLAVTADTTNAIISTPKSFGAIELRLRLHLTPRKK